MTNHIGTRVTFKANGNTGRSFETVVRTGLGDLDGTWHLVRFDDGLETWVHEASLVIWIGKPNVTALCD